MVAHILVVHIQAGRIPEVVRMPQRSLAEDRTLAELRRRAQLVEHKLANSPAHSRVHREHKHRPAEQGIHSLDKWEAPRALAARGPALQPASAENGFAIGCIVLRENLERHGSGPASAAARRRARHSETTA